MDQEVGMLCEILLTLLVTVVAGPDELNDARRLLQNGRYAEAQEAYEAILKRDDLPAPQRAKAVLGQADSLASQGEPEKAIAALDDLAGKQPENADLPARAADLKFTLGDWEGAEAAASRALKIDPDHLAAHWSRPASWRRAANWIRRSRPGSGSSPSRTHASPRSIKMPRRF